MTGRSTLSPEFCSTALKEWASIRNALVQGKQSILLRKGGIDEECGRFRLEHVAFWLYPTYVHQAEQGIRDRSCDAAQPADSNAADLDVFIKIDGFQFVNSKKTLTRLEPFHIWTAETVEKRFAYRSPGLWVLSARVFRAAEPRRLDIAPDWAGCKSWVDLGRELSTADLSPVRSDEEAAKIRRELEEALGGPLSTDSREAR